MVLYKVTVYTGEMVGAGTSNSIYLELHGTKGSSPPKYLSESGSQEAVEEYDIECDDDLGQLYMMKLSTESHFFWPNTDWFCSKVTVTTPEGLNLLFPCYTWITTDKPMFFREATALLPFQETIPEAKQKREEELAYRSETYKWSEFADGLPQSVQVDSPLALPKEVQFSFNKTTEFLLTIGSALIELKLEGFTSAARPWESMEEINQLYVGKRSDIFKYVKKHWKEDEFFGYQFLNGINPMLIQRCSELPENFPVTEDMVKTSLQGRSLAQEIKNGNIFLVDYKRIDGLMANVINDKQQYLTAPLVLLYKTPDDKMMPIAIQLKQQPGPQNPIFLPTDPEYDWLLAKTFVRSADFVEHELNFHLLRTHLMSEVFTMATLRNMPMVHPLYKLLMPHFRYTLQIDTLARAQLINADGVFSTDTAVGGPSMLKFMQRAVDSVTYSSLCLPEDITARGMEAVPDFYYMEDGLRLWKMTHGFVKGVVEHYYSSDSDVQKDNELQSWINEVFVFGFLARKDSGIPRKFDTVPELIKFLTMVIFTASAQHAAVNNGQYDFDGWVPNAPWTMQLPPPTTKGQSTEKTLLNTLPDVNATAKGVAAVYLLSKQSTDFVALGDSKQEQFVEKTILDKIEQLQKNLLVFHYQVMARNVRLTLPYIFLNPNKVENSVAI